MSSKPKPPANCYLCVRCGQPLESVKVFQDLYYCSPCREIEVRAARLAQLIHEFDAEPDETIE